jgi:hypothetical protein
MLRIPGSINHKPSYQSPQVELVDGFRWHAQSMRPKLLPQSRSLCRHVDGVRNFWQCLDRQKVFERYRLKLHLRPRTLIRHAEVKEGDRSKCIFEIIAGLADAGASADEIAIVLWGSPYFVSKHGKSEERLCAEITRILAKVEGRR